MFAYGLSHHPAHFSPSQCSPYPAYRSASGSSEDEYHGVECMPTAVLLAAAHESPPHGLDGFFPFYADSPFCDSRSADVPQPEVEVTITGPPETGCRTRVETQVKFQLHLAAADDQELKWSTVVVPACIDPKKVAAAVSLGPAEEADALTLKVIVIANWPETSNVASEYHYAASRTAEDSARPCPNCLARECKRRNSRKKSICVEPVDATATDIQAASVVSLACFSPVLKIADDGSVAIPMRFVCYSRHQGKSTGYRVVFQLRNNAGVLVAAVMSPPVTVIDDHKTVSRRVSNECVPLSGPVRGSATPGPTMSRRNSSEATATIRRRRSTSSALSAFPSVAESGPSTGARSEMDWLVEMVSPTESFAPPTIVTAADDLALDTSYSPPLNSATSLSHPEQSSQPFISAIIPNQGPTTGGMYVMLTGTGFQQGDYVSFGGLIVPTTLLSDTELVCVLPRVAFSMVLSIAVVQQPSPSSAPIPVHQPMAPTFWFNDSTSAPAASPLLPSNPHVVSAVPSPPSSSGSAPNNGFGTRLDFEEQTIMALSNSA